MSRCGGAGEQVWRCKRADVEVQVHMVPHLHIPLGRLVGHGHPHFGDSENHENEGESMERSVDTSAKTSQDTPGQVRTRQDKRQARLAPLDGGDVEDVVAADERVTVLVLQLGANYMKRVKEMRGVKEMTEMKRVTEVKG